MIISPRDIWIAGALPVLQPLPDDLQAMVEHPTPADQEVGLNGLGSISRNAHGQQDTPTQNMRILGRRLATANDQGLEMDSVSDQSL